MMEIEDKTNAMDEMNSINNSTNNNDATYEMSSSGRACATREMNSSSGTDVTNTDEQFYLLGHPVSHSKSPAMYNAVYRRLGLPWTYELMDLADGEEARRFVYEGTWRSINITTPYKPLALEAATVVGASARLAQGSNLLIRKGDARIAYNTDGEGCIAFLERAGISFDNARVVVCGTGPTALAILHSAACAGAAEVVLLSRDKEKSQRVLQDYLERFDQLAHATIELPALKRGHRSFKQAYDETVFKFGSYTSSKQAISAADLIVDATSLGMKPDDPAPFDITLLQLGQVVFDTVYGHGTTALVGAARDRGLKVFDGAGMLVAQAVQTLAMVFDVMKLDQLPSFDELFNLMAEAAGFQNL